MKLAILPLTAMLCFAAGVAAAAEPAVTDTTVNGRVPEQALVTLGDEYPDELGFLVPDYAKLQTGGFLGAFHASLGWSAFEDVLAIGGGYGFAPEDDGIGPYHAVTATLTLRPLRINPAREWLIVPLYLGGGLLGAFGDSLFFEQPEVYPSGYYRPSALHALVFAGLEVALRADQSLFKRHGLFVEVVTINQYLDAVIQNRTMRLMSAFSTSLGYRAML
jgi:hypothetical protein